MQNLRTLRILLLPFSWLYGGMAALRNWFFKTGLKHSFRFDFPVISVGNLSTGGTGKTPHIEFMIRLLKNTFTVGVVSRGYGRKTRGIYMVTAESSAAEVGDEPLQIKLNHPEAKVAVGEQRILAIPALLNEEPGVNVVLLDDAYQHRYVTPGLNILLTDYNAPFYADHVLPAGNLREFKAGYKRADILIVTKCPSNISSEEKERIKANIQLLPHQQVYFSWLGYGLPYSFADNLLLQDIKNRHVVFFAGIANTTSVEQYLKANAASYEILKFPDHNNYTVKELETVRGKITSNTAPKKVLLTTQKDAVKLNSPELKNIALQLPLFILPLEIEMAEAEKQQFGAQIRTYITKEVSLQTDTSNNEE